MIYERTRALIEYGRSAAALAEARRLLAGHTEAAHGFAGEALIMLGRLDEAAAEAPNSGDDEPYILGLIARDRGNKGEALSQLRKARQKFALNRDKRKGARRCGRDYVAVVDAEIAKLGAP
jgi:hypothetical protein